MARIKRPRRFFRLFVRIQAYHLSRHIIRELRRPDAFDRWTMDCDGGWTRNHEKDDRHLHVDREGRIFCCHKHGNGWDHHLIWVPWLRRIWIRRQVRRLSIEHALEVYHGQG